MKQVQIAWLENTYFQVRAIKKKEKHGKYSVEVHNVNFST